MKISILQSLSFKKLTLIVILCFIGGAVFITPPVYWWNKKRLEKLRGLDPGFIESLNFTHPPPRVWLPLHAVSRYLLEAILVAEDARFYDHPGIDVREIFASFKLNLRMKRYQRGGSTITQQVIRTLYLKRDKTLYRKSREVLGALLIEFFLDKNQILELYINFIDFGAKETGVHAACVDYFQRSCDALNLQQSIAVALVLPAPKRYGHDLRHESLSSPMKLKWSLILKKLQKKGIVTEDLLQVSLRQGVWGQPIED